MSSADLPSPHPIPLVKSSLQKAVRRGLPQQAVAAAAYLLAHEPVELLRRLPVVLCEDATIFEELPQLTWLMVAVQYGYVLTQEDVCLVLELTAAAAMHPEFRSAAPYSLNRAEKALGELWKGSTDGQELLSRCLTLRSCYGGMACDVELLLSLAAAPELWTRQVASTRNHPKAHALAAEWLKTRSGLATWAGPLESSLQVEAAVDFHCSDILPRLLSYLQTRQVQFAGPVPSEEELKSVMWTHRSSSNFRTPPGIVEPPTWWLASQEELSRLSRAFWSERRAATDRGPLPDAKRRKEGTAKAGASRQLSIFRFATPASAGG